MDNNLTTKQSTRHPEKIKPVLPQKINILFVCVERGGGVRGCSQHC
nr:MAG TPA: hypothetical protein [Caudoviricetes sp.]